MDAGVEMRVGTALNPSPAEPPAGVQLRLLGPMVVHRGQTPLALPPSRKARALLAYLALAARPVSRHHLSELLWDTPNDPRGELRWCLSKLRRTIDLPGEPSHVQTDGDLLRLQGPLAVDVAQIDAAARGGLAAMAPDALQLLLPRFEAGDFLEGLEIAAAPGYAAWLAGQRHRLRALHAAVLDHLSARLPLGGDDTLTLLMRWVGLAPFERRAHTRLLQALAGRGQLREGDAHLQGAVRLFEAEGQDAGPLVHAWRAARAAPSLSASPPPAAAPAAAPAAWPPAVSTVLLVAADDAPAASPAPARPASIAVMPFDEPGLDASQRLAMGASLAHDLTLRLARMRALFVIAHGSATALRAQGLGAEQSARVLDVDYAVGGMLWRGQDRVRLQVQLMQTRTARIVWADQIDMPAGDTLALLDDIGNQLVRSVASQVELAERQRAILKPPYLLDAWEAHHRGLWHMYRFHHDDNEQARQSFETAVRLDPTFSRAYAGLSFTHFQNAFLGWGDRDAHIEQAYRIASQGALADDEDPSARWALGRAHWLRGDMDSALSELETAVDLSPNFSLGHYTLAFVRSQSGDAHSAIAAVDLARELSPYDPLLFGMLASRALALMRLGRHDEAADFALKAIARPNAHVHILCIAVNCLALAGRLDLARSVADDIQRRAPGYTLGDWLTAFRLGDDALALVHRAQAQIGMR
jgi:DNA-binding SARP family transcriptional activator/TolB-like protein